METISHTNTQHENSLTLICEDGTHVDFVHMTDDSYDDFFTVGIGKPDGVFASGTFPIDDCEQLYLYLQKLLRSIRG